MRSLSWLVVLALAVAASLFAVANRGLVTVDLWPLEARLDVPVFIAILAAFAAGFVVGGAVAWSAGGKVRARARAAARRADALEREVVALQHRLETAPPFVPAPRKPSEPIRLTAERANP